MHLSSAGTSDPCVRCRNFDVVIGGGGTVGLALACALADALGADARIALVDRGTCARRGGRDIRASALSAGSKRLLPSRRLASDRASTPSRSPPSTSPIRSLHDAIRPILVSYDNTLEGDEPATYIVENERLRQALLAAAPPGRPSLCWARADRQLCGRRARRQHPPRQPRTLRAPLLVAADGRASRLRDSGRHQRRALELSADRHRHHRRPRAAAPRPRRAAFPARRARSPSCR